MGTQFTSRLSAGDARKVRSRVRSAWRSVAAPRSGGRAKIIDALSTADRRKLGDTTMAEILQVAEEHSFSEDFSESRVFVDVLDWLKRLQTNAKYNGFQGMIKEYDLDNAPTPSSELGRQLDALAVKAQGSQPDRYRRGDADTQADKLRGHGPGSDAKETRTPTAFFVVHVRLPNHVRCSLQPR